jgi:ASC-1-like (ASCH) protein
VIQDNQVMSLDATDSLHRKLMAISKGDDFLLSWEQFTTDEGQLRNYWKLEKVSKESANPQFENVKKSVNEAVQTTNSTFTNGARFGMIFNNVVKLYIENGMKWTKEEFAAEFSRVEGWVELCENKPNTPVSHNELKQYERKIEEAYPEKPVQIDDDELPF